MKKILITLYALLIIIAGLSAQQMDARRTVKTKVVDAVGQMPIANQQEYNLIMDELASTGEEGVSMLLKMLNAPGKGSNAQVDYALSGLTHFVSTSGKEKHRTVIVTAYQKCLEQLDELETKAFIIRQLQIIGNDGSVPILKKYLQYPNLSSPAATALAAINTAAAQQTLVDALKNASLPLKKTLVNAIATTRNGKAETALLDVLACTTDSVLERETLFALACCGSKQSLLPVFQKANESGFTLDKNSATDSYILLIKKMIASGDINTARDAAKKLFDRAGKANAEQTEIAALQLLLTLDNSQKRLAKALKNPSIVYRNAALSTIGKDAIEYLGEKLKKADPEVKVDILNWFGNQRVSETAEIIIPYLSHNDKAISGAAIQALTKIGGDKARDAFIAQIKSNDTSCLQMVIDALRTFSGDIATPLIAILPEVSEQAKVGIISLLAARKADQGYEAVLALTQEKNPVKKSAYAALKDLATEKDLPQLFKMLLLADDETQKWVQEAIISGMSTLQPQQRNNMVEKEMQNVEKKKQYLFYAILASNGNPKSLKIIVDGFYNSDSSVKDIAFDALSSWKGFDAAKYLYEISVAPENKKYAMKAINAYINKIKCSGFTNERKLIYLRYAMEVAITKAQKISILKEIGKTKTFLGMMFVGNYLENRDLQQVACDVIMTTALSNPPYKYSGLQTTELLNRVMEVVKGADSDYQKQAIRKYLDEQPKETGFVSIFNGKDLTGWKGLVQNPIARAKMTPKQLDEQQVKANELVKKSWKVVNGELQCDSMWNNLCTEKKYGDFEMYIDWKLDPKGTEPDAGIYLRGTPQVQMWDITRTHVGAQVGSGGLYNNKKNMSNPLKVADNPLGDWNSFYIKMVGERVTVYLNGELVTDNVIMENYWDRNLPLFAEEQIELQAHGSKVSYRDIYIKELSRPEPYEVSEQEKKEGFKALFDGVNMHEWSGNTLAYVPENGCIVMHPSTRYGGNLYTKKEFGNFIFRFDFKLTEGANNGLGIRTPLEGDAAYLGMELQILDNDAAIYKDLAPYQYHGSVYGIITAKRGFLKPVGEWNTQEVIADGNHIKVILNGEVILDGDIKEATKNGSLDNREHPGLFNKTGHIAFLGHGSEVHFKNIRIKELK